MYYWSKNLIQKSRIFLKNNLLNYFFKADFFNFDFWFSYNWLFKSIFNIKKSLGLT